MWKYPKNIDHQDVTLDKHIQKCRSPVAIPQPLLRIVTDNSVKVWNPRQDFSTWTIERLQTYLQKYPGKPPRLHEIIDFEETSGNPRFLCVFRKKNKELQLYINSSILAQVPMYENELKKGLILYRNSQSKFID